MHINIVDEMKDISKHYLPCFDPNTICGTRKLGTIDSNSWNVVFWIMNSQASNTVHRKEIERAILVNAYRNS